MTTIKEAAAWAIKTLGKSRTASLDADVLLANVTGVTRAFLMAHPESVIKESEWTAFRKHVLRRKSGEPVPYIIEKKEFYGRTFRVTPAVLIPRPETEHLVDAVLETFDNSGVTVAEIGTGSGAIAVALKFKAPNMHVIAVDLSKEALLVAKENAQANEVDLSFSQGDLVEPLHSKVDGLVANLPYLTAEDLEAPELAFEPRLALDGGADGLDVFHTFFLQAPKVLKPNGKIFLEIGSAQAAEVTDMAKKAFPSAKVEVRKDLAGLDRVVIVHTSEKRYPARAKTMSFLRASHLNFLRKQ